MNQQLSNIINSFQADQPVVSAFHEWSPVDHSLEEIRVLLKNSKKDLQNQGDSVEIIDKILSKENVYGFELKLEKEISLGEKYVALYMSGDQIRPQNISLPVKNINILGSKPFVLPLLFEKNFGDTICLILNDENCTAFGVSGANLDDLAIEQLPKDLNQILSDILVSKKIPKGLNDENLSRDNLELSEGSLSDKRQKMANLALDTLTSQRPELKHLVVFASNRFVDHVKNYVVSNSGLLQSIDVIQFVPSGKTAGDKVDTIRKKLESVFADKEVASPLPEFRSKPVLNSTKVVYCVDSGVVDEVFFDEGMLRFHLQTLSQSSHTDLQIVNDWVVDHIDRMPAIKAAPNLGCAIAATTYRDMSDLDPTGLEFQQVKDPAQALDRLYKAYLEA